MYTISFENWLAAKLWLFLPLSFLFTFTQLPMLLRHGLAAQAEDEVVENTPPE
jgi:intracellular septation protein